MVPESITGIVRKYLQQLTKTGVGIAYGVVFGSQVKGNTDLSIFFSAFFLDRFRH